MLQQEFVFLESFKNSFDKIPNSLDFETKSSNFSPLSNKDSIVLCSTTLVSSNSCWTRVSESASAGSLCSLNSSFSQGESIGREQLIQISLEVFAENISKALSINANATREGYSFVHPTNPAKPVKLVYICPILSVPKI
jgi:hypothetical protein